MTTKCIATLIISPIAYIIIADIIVIVPNTITATAELPIQHTTLREKKENVCDHDVWFVKESGQLRY